MVRLCAPWKDTASTKTRITDKRKDETSALEKGM